MDLPVPFRFASGCLCFLLLRPTRLCFPPPLLPAATTDPHKKRQGAFHTLPCCVTIQVYYTVTTFACTVATFACCSVAVVALFSLSSKDLTSSKTCVLTSDIVLPFCSCSPFLSCFAIIDLSIVK